MYQSWVQVYTAETELPAFVAVASAVVKYAETFTRLGITESNWIQNNPNSHSATG